MDIVTILRELWRRRALVLVAAALAMVAGVTVTYRITLPTGLESRQQEVGVATARIFVDTPDSQVVEISPKGSDSLGVRATLLANLMVEGDFKAAIARRAGLPAERLFGQTETASEPAAVPRTGKARTYVIDTRVVSSASGGALPIIEIEAQAPDARAASRLADAAVDGLSGYLDSKAATEAIPPTQRLRVAGLGPPQARTEERGPGPLVALAVMVFVFGAGCAAIVAAGGLARAWHAASDVQRRAEDQASAASDEPLGDVGASADVAELGPRHLADDAEARRVTARSA